jgi:hypothetical protein
VNPWDNVRGTLTCLPQRDHDDRSTVDRSNGTIAPHSEGVRS